MKRFLFLFILIFLLSVGIVHYTAHMAGDNITLVTIVTESIGNEDKALFQGTVLSVSEKMHDFDDAVFKIVSGSDFSDIDIDNTSFVDINHYKTKTTMELISGAMDYYSKCNIAKVAVARNGISDTDFITDYDAVGYNANAAEAMMRITSRYLKEPYDNIFLPDKVTNMILEKGIFYKDDLNLEDYEKVLRWYLAYSALQSSFDVNYLQILFGKNFYSKKEITEILYRMGSILETLKNCELPYVFKGAALQSYNMAAYSYGKKMELAEYYALSPFPGVKYVNTMVKNIYSFGSMSQAIATGIGDESFKTLGLVTVFELYSYLN